MLLCELFSSGENYKTDKYNPSNHYKYRCSVIFQGSSPFFCRCWLFETRSFSRIQQNTEKIFLIKRAECIAQENFPGRQAEHSPGKFRFLLCLVFTQRAKQDLSFPRGRAGPPACWICRNCFSVLGSKYRLNSDVCWDKECILSYNFLSVHLIKEVSCWKKRTNTAPVHSVLSFYCPNKVKVTL